MKWYNEISPFYLVNVCQKCTSTRYFLEINIPQFTKITQIFFGRFPLIIISLFRKIGGMDLNQLTFRKNRENLNRKDL